MYRYIIGLFKNNLETDDDILLFEALEHNDIKHACQAIREAYSGEVIYQHLTLRFGENAEQSVYQYQLSTQIKYCLDLFSFYLALRQSRFQLETFHPDFINNVVVPIQLNALTWPPGQYFLSQLFSHHKKALAHVIPSIQIQSDIESVESIAPLLEKIEGYAHTFWFEVSPPYDQFEQLMVFKPSMVKVSVSLKEKQDRQAFLPIVKLLRRHKLKWVASRVATQTELNQYKLLGAHYYFGYFSDIPTSLSFRHIDNYISQ
jgi:hypothetical protein